MRQGSAFKQPAPHFSLPQRQIIVPATQTDALEDAPAKTRRNSSHPWPKQDAVEDDARGYDEELVQASQRRTDPVRALVPIPASTALAEVSDSDHVPSPADLRLIPA